MHELRFLVRNFSLALGCSAVSRMTSRGLEVAVVAGAATGHGVGPRVGSAQPEDRVGSGSAQGQDQD